MPDRFDSVWHKLDRALHHAADVNRQIESYFGAEPYRFGKRLDTAAGSATIVVEEVREPLPISVALAAGDAVHNIRSAFDHFAWTVTTSPRSTTSFPIWAAGKAPTRSEWNGLIKNRLGPAKRVVTQAIAALEPYQGGSQQWLWELHALDVLDKHRLLPTITSTSAGIEIDGAAMLRRLSPDSLVTVPDDLTMPVRLYALDRPEVAPGTEVFATTKAEDMDDHVAFTKVVFHVVLEQPGSMGTRPVSEVLTGWIESSRDLLVRLTGIANA